MPQTPLDLRPVEQPQLLNGPPKGLDLQPLPQDNTESLLYKIFVYPAKGLTETLPQGMQQMMQPGLDAKAQGFSTMLHGLVQAATPFAIPAMAAAPIAVPVGTAAGMAGEAVGNLGARVLGLPPGMSSLAGDVGGIAGGVGSGLAAHAIGNRIPPGVLFKAALRNAPYIKSIYNDPVVQEFLKAPKPPAPSGPSPYFAGGSTGEPGATAPVLSAPPGYQPPVSGALPGSAPATAATPVAAGSEDAFVTRTGERITLDDVAAQFKKPYAKLGPAEQKTALAQFNTLKQSEGVPTLTPPPGMEGVSFESPVDTSQVPTHATDPFAGKKAFKGHTLPMTDLLQQFHKQWGNVSARDITSSVYGTPKGTMPTYDQLSTIHEWMLNHNGKIPGPGDIK